MTEQIRKNVFETNSSSSHSLTLSESDIIAQPFTDEVLRAGTIFVTKDEYGWEWHRYYSTSNKMDYLFTQMFRDSIPGGNPHEVTAQLREDNARFDMLCRVVEEHTGVKVLASPGSSGYIDHDSVGVGMDLFDDEEALRRFLFTDTSCVETGNDNSGPGKQISTDRGSEDYFAKHYREPKESDVAISLYSKCSYGVSFYSLRTEGGAVIEHDEDNPSGLFKELQEQATVVAAHFKSKSHYHPFEYGEPEGDTMANLVDEKLYFTGNLKVTVDHTPVKSFKDGEDMEVTLTVFVPKELAERIANLSAANL